MPIALSDEELDVLIERFDALVGRSLRRAVRAGTSEALTAAGVEGPQQVDSDGELHTGAMIALVPKDPENWVLAGGEAADSLHVTLAYLGDSDNIPDHVVDTLYEAINNLAAHLSPINAEIFGANIWNPDSDSPSLNAAIGGSNVDLVHNYIQRVILLEVDEDLEWAPPENHSPWNAHMCLAYGNTETLKNKLEDALKLVGPITFDRVRFAQGGESTDYFLHDAEVEDDPAEMVAAAEPLPEPGPPPAYEPPPPIPTPILPAVTVALDDLVRIERAWRQEIQNIIIPELERTMRKAADAVLKDIAFEAPVLWDVSQPSAQAFLTQTKNQLVGVGEDMWLRTRDQLIMGMQDGDSIQQLSARVKEVLGTTDTRARAIARTEVIGASNAGAMQQLELLGEDAPARKTWLATRDGRTRLSHAAANGQTVDFVAPFTVGGAKFDYPGDPDAPASERVNCRCTLVWHFDDLPLKTPVPIRSAGALEMFAKAGDPYVRDNHGRFAPKGGGGGGGAGATGGSKKVLKPANVDTSRLNAAEAKELADIEADFAAGNIDAAKYKYKTYYVKVKASKRINKSGGAGKGTELDTKVTPDKKPGADLKNGDVVKLPSGKTGVIVGQTEVSATVETPDGDSFVFNKGKLKKADSEPKVSVAPSSGFKDVKPLGPAVNDGDSVNTPGGPGKVLKQNSKGVLVEHADGGQDVYDAGSVTKQPAMPGVGGAKSGSPVAIKKGDTVDTPDGPAKVLNETPSIVFVEYPNGDVAFINPSKLTKDGAPVAAKTLPPIGSVNTGGKAPSYQSSIPSSPSTPSSVPMHAPAPKKQFVKPSQVNPQTHFNSAEHAEMDDLNKKFASGELSDTEYKKKAYYVKVKASKRINKNAGVSKPSPGGSSTDLGGVSTDVPGMKSGGPGVKSSGMKHLTSDDIEPAKHFNAAENSEVSGIAKLYGEGKISQKQYLEGIEAVKVKAASRINKRGGVPLGIDVTPAVPRPLPPQLASRTSLTRKTAAANAEGLQGKARNDLTAAKQKPGAWDDPVIGPQLKAHSAYTGSSYTPINTLARSGKLHGSGQSTAAKHIKNLDTAFQTFGYTTNQPIVVHRGVRGQYSKDIRNLNPGDIITERGFMSTSVREKKPKDFAGSAGALMEIHVPPGKRTMAGTDYEHELLFPRNTKLQYLGRSSTGAVQFTMIE